MGNSLFFPAFPGFQACQCCAHARLVFKGCLDANVKAASALGLPGPNRPEEHQHQKNGQLNPSYPHVALSRFLFVSDLWRFVLVAGSPLSPSISLFWSLKS